MSSDIFVIFLGQENIGCFVPGESKTFHQASHLGVGQQFSLALLTQMLSTWTLERSLNSPGFYSMASGHFFVVVVDHILLPLLDTDDKLGM